MDVGMGICRENERVGVRFIWAMREVEMLLYRISIALARLDSLIFPFIQQSEAVSLLPERISGTYLCCSRLLASLMIVSRRSPPELVPT